MERKVCISEHAVKNLFQKPRGHPHQNSVYQKQRKLDFFLKSDYRQSKWIDMIHGYLFQGFLANQPVEPTFEKKDLGGKEPPTMGKKIVSIFIF